MEILKMILFKKRFMECLGWFMLGFSIHWILDLRNVFVFIEPVAITSQHPTKTTNPPNHEKMKRRQRAMTKSLINESGNSTTSTSSSSSSSSSNESAIKFVFFVGLEGTGHHLMASILHKSPMKDRLLKNGLLESKKIILTKLFDKTLDPNRGDKGLWDAHCNHPYKPIDTIRIKEKLTSKLRRLNTQLLKKMKNKKKKNGNGNDDNKNLIFPINTLWSTSGFGMISYPNFGGWQEGGCRFLSYPNLDLWYDVCDMADVSCQHIMLYRDPIQILHSTVNKRGFNPNLLMSTYLYTTMLHIIESQLSTYSKKQRRTIGCYGFYEPTNVSWLDSIRDLFWSTTTKSNTNTSEEVLEYESVINSIYRPPKPVTLQDLLQFNSTTNSSSSSSLTSTSSTQNNNNYLEMYMKLIYKIHNRTIDKCNDGLN